MIERTDPTTGEVIQMTEAAFEAAKLSLTAEWQKLDAELSRAKALEMDTRKRLDWLTFGTRQQFPKGTEYVDLTDGWKLKCERGVNFGWIKDGRNIDRTAIDNALVKIENSGMDGAKLMAERLVKFEPKLSVTEYNQLPGMLKAIIDEVIVTSDAASKIELVAPKVPK